MVFQGIHPKFRFGPAILEQFGNVGNRFELTEEVFSSSGVGSSSSVIKNALIGKIYALRVEST